MTPTTAPGWPLITRDQFETVLTELEHAPCGVVLCGSSGVGKTRLAESVRAHLSAESLAFTCRPDDADIPLTAAGFLIGDTDGLLPDSRASVERRAREILADLDVAGPVLVLADDVQWLDSASADLLASLARSGAIRLLCTARTPLRLPWAFERLVHDDSLRRIDVDGLSIAETLRLLDQHLVGPVDREVARQLVSITDGNAMYVREVVRAATASGDIRQVRGVWSSPDGALPTGARLTDLVDAELSRLDPPHRRALEFVALTEPIPLPVLLQDVGLGALEVLEAAGLIRLGDPTGPPEVRMAHPLYASETRRLTPPRRKRELHTQVYDGAVPEKMAPGDFLRWITWALGCGIDVEPREFVRAARSASALGQAHFAMKMARTAIDRLDPDQHPLDLVDALLVSAWEQRFAGNAEEALADIDRAGKILATGPEGDLASRVAQAGRLRADVLQYSLDDVEGALATLRSSAASDQGLVEAVRRAWAGEFDQVLAALPHLETADAATRPELLEAVGPAMLALTWRGEVDRALDLSLRYWDAALEAVDRLPWALAEIFSTRFFTYIQAGRAAGLQTAEHLDMGEVARQDSGLGRAGDGMFWAAIGDWPTALRENEAALRTFALRDPSGLQPWAASATAAAAMMTGDRARAAELLDSCAGGCTRTSRALEADALINSTRTAIGLGLADAAERAVHLEGWARARGFDLVRLEALHLLALTDRARLVAHLDVTPALPGDSASAPVMGLFRRHIEAVVGADAALVRTAMQDLASVGRWPPATPVVASLSKREQEIAVLVAAGLSSPEIAERLHLSARTIESHVSRIFTKLDVRRRSEIAAALSRQG